MGGNIVISDAAEIKGGRKGVNAKKTVTISGNAKLHGGEDGLYCNNAKAELTNGTFSGGKYAINIENTDASIGNEFVSELLAHTSEERYAYYVNDTLITENLNTGNLTGTIMIKPCSHDYQTIDNKDGTHYKLCSACDDKKDAEICEYKYTYHDNKNHIGTCSICGAKKEPEEHEFSDWIKEENKENSYASSCPICDYKKEFKLNICDNVKITYGQTKELTINVEGTQETVACQWYLVKENGETEQDLYEMEEIAGAVEMSYTPSPESLNIGENKFAFIITVNGQKVITNGKNIISITVEPASIENAEISLNYAIFTYNGQEQIPEVELVVDKKTLEKDSDYTIEFLNNINAGTAIVKITGQNHYTGIVQKEFTIQKAEVTITEATAIDRNYNGSTQVEISDINLDGIINRDDVNIAVEGLTGTIPEKKAGSYHTITLTGDLKLTGKDIENYVLIPPSDSIVLTKAVTIEKAEAFHINTINKSYIYTVGTNGNLEVINFAEMIPEDSGVASYKVIGNAAYISEKNIDIDGTLSYKVGTNGTVGDIAVLSVVISTDNYKDSIAEVEIALRDKILPKQKVGAEVEEKGEFVYGSKLGDLELNGIFEADGKEVSGVLTWAGQENEIFSAGNKKAEWVFTPEDSNKYHTVKGEMELTILKASPKIITLPTTASIVFHPNIALNARELYGGSTEWTINGKKEEIEGIWNWKQDTVIPEVGSNQYDIRFTPRDSNNFNTVEASIIAKVEKATPVIATMPAIKEIVYGQTLGEAVLSDFAVQYSNDPSIYGYDAIIDGSFVWNPQEIGIMPSVTRDSGKTKYSLMFIPNEENHYNTVVTASTIIVRKAEKPQNIPEDEIKTENHCIKIRDIILPEGWEWQENEKEKELEVEIPVTAAAIYQGIDKGNYEKETVIVTVIRSACEHIGGTASCIKKAVCEKCGEEYGVVDNNYHEGDTELRNQIKANCTRDGYTGDNFCMSCNKMIASGAAILALGHDYESKITKEPSITEEGIRTYTCKNCGYSYTEKIDKLIDDKPNDNRPSTPIKPGNNNSGNITNTGNSGSVAKPENTTEPEENENQKPEEDKNNATVETITETKPDGSKVETITEIKPDGSKVETVTETKPDGSKVEKKEVQTDDSNAVLISTTTISAENEVRVNTIIRTGDIKKDNQIDITDKLFSAVAEENKEHFVIVEITDTTIKTANNSSVNNKNMKVVINFPQIANEKVEKIVLTKESIEAAKETGKALVITINQYKNKEGSEKNSYKVRIPAKQISNIEEEIDLIVHTCPVVEVSDSLKRDNIIKKVNKSGGKEKKTGVVSIVENKKIPAGIKVQIPVKNAINISSSKTIYIYKYNNTGKLEEIAYSCQKVSNNGTITIEADFGTDYILSLKKLKGKQIKTIKDNIFVSVSKKQIKSGKTGKVIVKLPETISEKKSFGKEKVKISYQSKNKKIAVVSKSGTITAKKKGTTEIIVKILLENGQEIRKKQKIVIK